MVFIILLYFYIRDIDKDSLKLYLITGLSHSVLELIAQGGRIRVIEDAYIFQIPIGYPYICFILGFFEGGLISLAAYHFVKIYYVWL
ncbi:MAG: hypothetical protein ACFE8A_15290 [Candidatus Hodarchaeota archaeon]